jgi:hypothetical protein
MLRFPAELTQDGTRHGESNARYRGQEDSANQQEADGVAPEGAFHIVDEKADTDDPLPRFEQGHAKQLGYGLFRRIGRAWRIDGERALLGMCQEICVDLRRVTPVGRKRALVELADTTRIGMHQHDVVESAHEDIVVALLHRRKRILGLGLCLLAAQLAASLQRLVMLKRSTGQPEYFVYLCMALGHHGLA